jgi:hypothetical protein
MDSAAETATVVIRPSMRAEVDPWTRQDVDELVRELTADGRQVTLQLPDPGQF